MLWLIVAKGPSRWRFVRAEAPCWKGECQLGFRWLNVTFGWQRQDLHIAHPSGGGISPRNEESIHPAVSESWRCFHCGFETVDYREARSHFGDRDEESPLCLTWRDLDADGRASEYGSVLEQLVQEREENARLCTMNDGLEYQVTGQIHAIKSFRPFRDCETINQVFHVYDSMEGRALVAEAALRWRPISEMHEDYGQCVLMNLADPGGLELGNNLDLDWDETQWTHFAQVPRLTTKDAERMALERPADRSNLPSEAAALGEVTTDPVVSSQTKEEF